MKLRKKISEAKLQVIANDYVIMSIDGQDHRLYVGDEIATIHQVNVDWPLPEKDYLMDCLRQIGFTAHEDFQ